ncbi:hypothetical protein BLA29_006750, partial [Euroglyphus maynei]
MDIFQISFIIIGLIVCILSVIFSILLNERFSINLWNKVYLQQNNDDDGNGKNIKSRQHIYVINVIYFHRKSTIDFSKTKVFITFFFGLEKISIQINPKFFRPNMFNESIKDYCVIKFLLITYTDIRIVEKIAITHDQPEGEFYVSMISIQNTKNSDGFISCIEQRIKSFPIETYEQIWYP